MSATLVGTLTSLTPSELSGELKLVCLTATLESASDTITVSVASHGISKIVGVLGVMTAGQDAECMSLQAAHSTTVITITSIGGNGAASSAWSDTTVEIWVLGY